MNYYLKGRKQLMGIGYISNCKTITITTSVTLGVVQSLFLTLSMTHNCCKRVRSFSIASWSAYGAVFALQIFGFASHFTVSFACTLPLCQAHHQYVFYISEGVL